jgi:hypothetical protein
MITLPFPVDSLLPIDPLRVGGAQGRQRFGLRWQSAAATPLSLPAQVGQSDVALGFPPQSKTSDRTELAGFSLPEGSSKCHPVLTIETL